MARRTTPDRFDELPQDNPRRGAHRAAATAGQRWMVFLWSALATIAIVVLGILGFRYVTGGLPGADTAKPTSSASVATKTPTPTPTPTITATLDPSVKVDVLNGTNTAGLATAQANKLTKAGWTIGAKDNAPTTVTATKVYYSNPALKGAALGVVQALGFGTAVQSDEFKASASPITVVLGPDVVN